MYRLGGFSKRLFIGALLCLVLSHTPAAAQALMGDNYMVGYISMADGLPANFVDYIYKDSDGFIWIATSGGGLTRYDGHDYFTLSTHSVPAVRSNFVTCMTEDNFHHLWVTSEEGLDIIDLNVMATLELPETLASETDGKHIHFITTDTHGCVWIKAEDSIVRVSLNKEGHIDKVLTVKSEEIRVQDNFLKDIEGDGSIWTCFGSKLLKIQAQDNSLIQKAIISDLPVDNSTYISGCLQKDNEIWISSDNGLLRYDRTTGKMRQYQYSPTDPNSLSQNFLTDIAVTGEGQIILSSLKGLNIYDSLSDCFERINSESSDAIRHTLSSDFINCLNVIGGQIWIGTESAGIVVISPKSLSIKNLSHDKDREFSIPSNPVNTILTDSYGKVWVGNVEGGLSCFVPGQDKFTNYTDRDSGLIHNSVSALECDRAGNLWVGTWGGGISLFDLENKKFFKDIVSAPDTPINYIGLLEYDTLNDNMWIGSNVGIFIYDCSTGSIAPALKTQPSGCIGSGTDGKNRLWIGCQQGLYVFFLDRKGADGKYEYEYFSHRLDSPEVTSNDWISSVRVAADGKVWIGSNGNGIYRLEDDDTDGEMHFTRFSSDQGLINDRVKGILDDEEGNIWISTDNGLSRFNQNTLMFTNYTTENGLASPQFYWNAFESTSDGQLMFGQMEGLTIINPEKDIEPDHTYSLVFTRMSIADKVIHAGDKPLSKDISCADKIFLHQRDKAISIEFAMLDYGLASPAIYSYRLKGFDEDWLTLKENRQYINYANLPAGNYTLQVRATNMNSKVLGENEIHIYVARYFYRTWWFMLLAVLFIVSMVITILKLRTRHLIQQREELLDIVNERTQEIEQQKKLLETKADELARQNKILLRQNEELAGHRILYSPEIRQSDTPKDDKFVAKAIETVREHYKNPDLDVATFCTAMGMSKTLLNKRLQEALGQSIGQFIRTYRLSIAREMLINNKESKTMNISEIAYETGFNDPKYFTRCFTKEYGTSPSSFANE